ncbi:hypothetical protein, partial [Actinomadura hibisca]|uniref:hypothetical protein n=1 Tax=Actinomadura hibisca TaxID=68565 RepID=UPI00083276F8
MSRRFRLATVLRARRAQENAAKAEVVRARSEAVTTAEHAQRLDRELDVRVVHPLPSEAAAFTAAMAARSAFAAQLAVAEDLAAQARGRTQARMTDWTAASGRRRAVERLGER